MHKVYNGLVKGKMNIDTLNTNFSPIRIMYLRIVLLTDTILK